MAISKIGQNLKKSLYYSPWTIFKNGPWAIVQGFFQKLVFPENMYMYFVPVFCTCRSSQLEKIARVGVTGVSNVHKLKKWIGKDILH